MKGGSYKKFPGGMACEMIQSTLAVGALELDGLVIGNHLHEVCKGIKLFDIY